MKNKKILSLKQKYLIKRRQYNKSWENFEINQANMSEKELLKGFEKHLYQLDELAFLSDRIAHSDEYVIIKIDTTNISYKAEQNLIYYLSSNKLPWKMRFVNKFD